MQAMADIFDTRTIAAANALLKDSGERWNELSGEIEDCNGAAKDMAATMLDNLEGDITILKSATEGLGIRCTRG
jgi:TP901 family phage tail tape measure protein